MNQLFGVFVIIIGVWLARNFYTTDPDSALQITLNQTYDYIVGTYLLRFIDELFIPFSKVKNV